MKFLVSCSLFLALPSALAGMIGERTIGFSDAANVQSFDNVVDWLDGFRCCLELTRVLPFRMLSPVQIFDYYDQRQTYWANQQRDISPACFVLPQSTQEVSTVMKTLSQAQCKFAIRSGGHSPVQGWNNLQAGVTLDLSDLSGVTVAADRSFVYIKPGSRWLDVYSNLQAQGLGTSGGRVATVGVGGLVTGGGVSFFSREKGLVCDNVLEFEVVQADGKIITADLTKNADLYRALKGGSGNFGIVTRIKMVAFEFSGNMWGGSLYHNTDATSRKALFDYFSNVYATSTSDVKAHWIHSWSYVDAGTGVKSWLGVSNVQYTDAVATTPPVFQPIVGQNVTAAAAVGPTTLTQSTLDLAAANNPGSRQLFATMSFKRDSNMMEELFKIADSTLQPIKNVEGLQYTISFQSLPYSAYKQAVARGGNSLGLENDTDDIIFTLLTATWSRSQDDSRVYNAGQQLYTQAKAKSSQLGVAKSFEYLNYAAFWQKPIAAYGSASVSRLRAAAAKYDPQQVFQKLVPAGFKI